MKVSLEIKKTKKNTNGPLGSEQKILLLQLTEIAARTSVILTINEARILAKALVTVAKAPMGTCHAFTLNDGLVAANRQASNPRNHQLSRIP